MRDKFLEKILACPKCKQKLTLVKNQARCSNCKISYLKNDGIWALIYFDNKKIAKSAKEYEISHQAPAGRISDGSYEILAKFSQGVKTLDIACGQGFLEESAPETVGLDFSLQALKKAIEKGAKNLVWATAENLPFINNSFELAICSGSLEQFANPAKAILEMGRVSKIQVLTVHREFNFPLARTLRFLLTKLLGVKNQPIEKPLKWSELEKMLEKAKLSVVYKGFWTLPVNFGKVFPILPVFTKIPSCFFVVTVKK